MPAFDITKIEAPPPTSIRDALASVVDGQMRDLSEYVKHAATLGMNIAVYPAELQIDERDHSTVFAVTVKYQLVHPDDPPPAGTVLMGLVPGKEAVSAGSSVPSSRRTEIPR